MHTAPPRDGKATDGMSFSDMQRIGMEHSARAGASTVEAIVRDRRLNGQE